MDDVEVALWVRDGMFAEREGIDGWPKADTALRASSFEALDTLATDLAAVGITIRPTIMASAADFMASGEALLSSAGLASLAAGLRVWFRRQDGKRVHVEYNGRTVDLQGLSVKQVEQILRSLTRLSDDTPAGAEDDNPTPPAHPVVPTESSGP